MHVVLQALESRYEAKMQYWIIEDFFTIDIILNVVVSSETVQRLQFIHTVATFHGLIFT